MLQQFLHVVLHLDNYLADWTHLYGSWIYLIVFGIVFAETGLVVFPFLPGDSLLFALGAISALPDGGIEFQTIWFILFLAVLLGDNLNYQVGYRLGTKLIQRKNGFIFFQPRHVKETQSYFEKYGILTVIIARFIPIVRTFSPFSAGLGKMKYAQFLIFSVFGSVLWISVFLASGYYVGNSPIVKRNFHLILLGVILVSVLPLIFGIIKGRIGPRAPSSESGES